MKTVQPKPPVAECVCWGEIPLIKPDIAGTVFRSYCEECGTSVRLTETAGGLVVTDMQVTRKGLELEKYMLLGPDEPDDLEEDDVPSGESQLALLS